MPAPAASPVPWAGPRRRPDRTPAAPSAVSGRLVALLLTRVAAGLGGFIAGTGFVHAVVAGNPYGLLLVVGGLALMFYGVRQAAKLSNKS